MGTWRSLYGTIYTSSYHGVPHFSRAVLFFWQRIQIISCDEICWILDPDFGFLAWSKSQLALIPFVKNNYQVSHNFCLPTIVDFSRALLLHTYGAALRFAASGNCCGLWAVYPWPLRLSSNRPIVYCCISLFRRVFHFCCVLSSSTDPNPHWSTWPLSPTYHMDNDIPPRWMFLKLVLFLASPENIKQRFYSVFAKNVLRKSTSLPLKNVNYFRWK